MKMSKKVLLIDDDSDEHLLFQDALESYDNSICCITADSYTKAINLIKEGTPDYIFLDFNMPVFNGLASLQEIKQTSALNNIPVYMYSISDISEKLKEKALELGAVQWLKKPSYMKDFCRIFSDVLG
jgi:CheY-like chemotaxis protein